MFDTNVVLDALLERTPWDEAAVALFDRVESGVLIGQLGATAVTTVHYVARRNVGTRSAGESIEDLLRLLKVALVNQAVLENALDLGFGDFEDAALHEAGCLAGATALVTRNVSDFSEATLRVYEPSILIAAPSAV